MNGYSGQHLVTIMLLMLYDKFTSYLHLFKKTLTGSCSAAYLQFDFRDTGSGRVHTKEKQVQTNQYYCI